MSFDHIIDPWRRRAEAMPLPNGPVPSGNIDAVLGGEVVILAIDSRGRVHQIEGGALSCGTIRYIQKGRSEVLSLIEKFGVEDWPDMMEENPHA